MTVLPVAHWEPSAVDAVLNAQVFPALKGHAFAQDSPPTRVAFNGRSAVYRWGTAEDPVALKIAGPGQPPTQRGAQEYEALCQVYGNRERAAATPVIRPVAYISEFDMTVTAWCAAPPLRFLIQTQPAAARNAVANTARWLQRYHSASDPVERPFRHQIFAGRLANHEARLEATLRERVAALLPRIADLLEDVVRGTSYPSRTIHGDGNDRNFLVDGERVVALDLSAVARGDVLEDYVRLMCRSIVSLLGRHDTHEARRLADDYMMSILAIGRLADCETTIHRARLMLAMEALVHCIFATNAGDDAARRRSAPMVTALIAYIEMWICESSAIAWFRSAKATV